MHENIIQSFDQFLLQSRSNTPFPCQPRWLRSWKFPRFVYRERYEWVEGRDSSVGIATRYGLDGSGTESRWGRGFPHPPRPALGSTQPPIQWAPGLSRGKSGKDVALFTHPNLVLRLKKEQSYTSTPPLGLRGLF